MSLGFEGGQFQTGIYLSGGYEWPLTYADWEAKARERLEQGPFDYVAGGAGSEATMRANLEAFDRRRLRPRMLTGNAKRDLTVEVLGTRSAAPFLLAPIGVLDIVHPDGELAVARASAATGVPMMLSSAASNSIEDVAEAMGDAPRWFQLYWVSDRTICESFVRRAEAAGYSAIVVTLDTLVLGWRPRDLANTYLPFIQGKGCAQFFSDPVFRGYLAAPPEDDVLCRGGADALDLPEPGADLGRPRVAPRPDASCRCSSRASSPPRTLRRRSRRRRHHRLEPRRPPGRRCRRVARRAGRGARRRRRRRDRARRQRHPHAAPT